MTVEKLSTRLSEPRRETPLALRTPTDAKPTRGTEAGSVPPVYPIRGGSEHGRCKRVGSAWSVEPVAIDSTAIFLLFCD